MGRKLLALAMVAVLTITFAGCGNGKKLVTVWVWDNVYDKLQNFLVNEDGSFMVRYGDFTSESKIALYDAKNAFLYTNNSLFSTIVNGRFVSYDLETSKSSIYDTQRTYTNRDVDGTLLERQIDKNSLLFRKIIDDKTDKDTKAGRRKLIKTNLAGLELWSTDFITNLDFYPVIVDDQEQMTMIVCDAISFLDYSGYFEILAETPRNLALTGYNEFWQRTTNPFLDIPRMLEPSESVKKVHLFRIVKIDYKSGKIKESIPIEGYSNSYHKMIDYKILLISDKEKTRMIDVMTGKTIFQNKLKVSDVFNMHEYPDLLLTTNYRTYKEKEKKYDNSNDDNTTVHIGSDPYGYSDIEGTDCTILNKDTGKIIWTKSYDYGILSDWKVFGNRLLLSFVKTTGEDKDKKTEYKTVAVNIETGEELWTKDCFLFEVEGNEKLNPVEIETFDESLGTKLRKKFVILASYINKRRSKELVDLETGKTVWKIDNPFGSQNVWMEVRNGVLYFVTNEGVNRYSVKDGTRISSFRFDRRYLGDDFKEERETRKLSEKVLGVKEYDRPKKTSRLKSDFEYNPVVKAGYLFVQGAEKLAIYDLYTLSQVYSSAILYENCDVVGDFVYLQNSEGIVKLKLSQQ